VWMLKWNGTWTHDDPMWTVDFQMFEPCPKDVNSPQASPSKSCENISSPGDYSVMCKYGSHALIILADICEVPYAMKTLHFDLSRSWNVEEKVATKSTAFTLSDGRRLVLDMSVQNINNNPTLKATLSGESLVNTKYPLRSQTICPSTCTALGREATCTRDYRTATGPVKFVVNVQPTICTIPQNTSAITRVAVKSVSGNHSLNFNLKNGEVDGRNLLEFRTSFMLRGGLIPSSSGGPYLPIDGGYVKLDVQQKSNTNHYQVIVYRCYPDCFPIFRKEFTDLTISDCTAQSTMIPPTYLPTDRSGKSSNHAVAISVTVVVCLLALVVVGLLFWRQYQKPLGYRAGGGLPGQMELGDDDFNPDL